MDTSKTSEKCGIIETLNWIESSTAKMSKFEKLVRKGPIKGKGNQVNPTLWSPS